jgi:hypothetical protein
MTTHGFTKQGAKRIVDAVRTVEANDPLYAGPKHRRQRPGAGPEAFVVGRVTEVDSADPTLLSVQEQYWSEDDAAMIDLPAGRTWDGGDGNPAKVRAVGGSQPAVDSLVVLGFRHGADGEGVWYTLPPTTSSFWAKITGNAADGTNKWKYAWTEQQRTATGWQDLSGGRSGTTSTDFAVNANEANNDGTGVQGNSIDIDGTVFDDNSDLEIQPVQGDPVVRVWAEMSSTATLVYTFEYVNAVDGECA